jgi:hypothetical protein
MRTAGLVKDGKATKPDISMGLRFEPEAQKPIAESLISFSIYTTWAYL